MTIQETIKNIHPLDTNAMQRTRRRWDSIAKPLHGLGVLEDILVQISGMTGQEEIRLDKRAVAVFCADNGVVEEGVTQTGQKVTAVVTENFSKGQASVNKMSAVAHVQVIPVDIGVAAEVRGNKILNRKIAYGTQNIAKGAAMTSEQVIAAVEVGIQLAIDLQAEGFQIFATGEMGIGNTTTSSAVTAVLLGLDPERVTGRGAGLSFVGLNRKIETIKKAIAVNKPNANNALDVLQKVGGFDLAGLCGFYLGAAACRIPIMIDGVISAAAALAAARICPLAKEYMLASHLSGEPAAKMLLQELGCKPVITAGLSLGEGTGAVALLPLLDMACAVYREMPTFEDNAIEEYEPLT